MKQNEVKAAVEAGRAFLAARFVSFKVRQGGQSAYWFEEFAVLVDGETVLFSRFVPKGVDPKSIVPPDWTKGAMGLPVVVFDPVCSVNKKGFLQTSCSSVEPLTA